MENSIYKSVSASANEVKLLDSLHQPVIEKDIALFIVPEFTRRNATIWQAGDFPATFQSRLKLSITGKRGEIIDSMLINAVGVSAWKNNGSHLLEDTIIADATDSAISSMQDQIVYNLTKNNKIRTYLGIPESINDLEIVSPAAHGLYGNVSKFELDTNSYDLNLFHLSEDGRNGL